MQSKLYPNDRACLVIRGGVTRYRPVTGGSRDGSVIMGKNVRCPRKYAANAITSVRLVLTAPFLRAVANAYQGGPSWPAALLFFVVALSDVVDGFVARATQTVSRGGQVFDHTADIVFLLAALVFFASRGAISSLIPVAVAVSFAAYVVDSWRLRRPGATVHLRTSRLGHAGGVVNYAFVAVLVGSEVCHFTTVAETVAGVLSGGVLFLAVASVASRVWGAGRARPEGCPGYSNGNKS